MLVAVTMLISAFFVIRRALRSDLPTTHESVVTLRNKEVRHV
jgi:carbon starvation protein